MKTYHRSFYLALFLLLIPVFVFNYCLQLWCFLHHPVWGGNKRHTVGQCQLQCDWFCKLCLDLLYDAHWYWNIPHSWLVHPQCKTRCVHFYKYLFFYVSRPYSISNTYILTIIYENQMYIKSNNWSTREAQSPRSPQTHT